MRSMSAVVETALVASFTLSPPFREEHDHPVSVRGHDRIVDAIEARDGPDTAAAMRAFIAHGAGPIATVEAGAWRRTRTRREAVRIPRLHTGGTIGRALGVGR